MGLFCPNPNSLSVQDCPPPHRPHIASAPFRGIVPFTTPIAPHSTIAVKHSLVVNEGDAPAFDFASYILYNSDTSELGRDCLVPYGEQVPAWVALGSIAHGRALLISRTWPTSLLFRALFLGAVCSPSHSADLGVAPNPSPLSARARWARPLANYKHFLIRRWAAASSTSTATARMTLWTTTKTVTFGPSCKEHQPFLVVGG